MIYDLEGRTLKFSREMLAVLSSIEPNTWNKNIINQLLRSATSVGANYREANSAISKSDFKNKVFICRKEINETKYWIELLADVSKDKKAELRPLWTEAQQLSRIFNKICFSLRNKQFKQEKIEE